MEGNTILSSYVFILVAVLKDGGGSESEADNKIVFFESGLYSLHLNISD